MGITLGKENLENIPHLRNKRNQSKSTDKVRAAIKEVALEEPTSFNHSERRSAIYID